MDALPEGNEPEDLPGLLALADVGVGVAKGPALRILGEKHEDAGLPAAARRHVMAFDDRMLPVVGDGMKVEVERSAFEEMIAGHRGMPRREELCRFAGIDAGRIFRQVALLRRDIEPRKERESLIHDQGHHVALALNGPELEGQTGAQGVRRRNHFGSREPGGARQGIQLQPDEVREEEEQAATPRGKPARRQGKRPHIRDRLDERARAVGSFLVQSPGQWREAFRLEHLPDGRRTQGLSAFLQGLADLVDRVILLPQVDNGVPRGRFLGLRLRAAPRRRKEPGARVAAEMVAQDSKGSDRVAKGVGGVPRGTTLNEVGPQGLVLAVPGMRGLEKEATAGD